MFQDGVVGSLWRYPVKSMLGESLTSAVVSERGLWGDRTHAIVDLETGRIASAKRPWLWRALLKCSARSIAINGDARTPSVHVTLGDGVTFADDDPRRDQFLTAFLGRSVRLVMQPPENAQIERADPADLLARGPAVDLAAQPTLLGRASPAGTFFDYAPVHLVTTATLEYVSARAGISPQELIRYRPNIVIQYSGAPFIENDWIGQTLRLGESIELQIIVATPRCAVPTLSHGSTAERREALTTLMQFNRVAIPGLGKLPCLGVYARVLKSGTVTLGDVVSYLHQNVTR